MGEASLTEITPSFNGSLKIHTTENKLSAVAGILLLRELDERLGFSGYLSSLLMDSREQDLITHPLVELVRYRVFTMAAGLGAQNNAHHLRNDPTLRLAVSTRRGVSPLKPADDSRVPDGIPSQATLSRMVDMLSNDHNVEALQDGLLEIARRDIQAHHGGHLDHVTIDIDSFPISAYGEQGGTAYNGYYKETCFHPLVMTIAETDHVVFAEARPGNVHTAEGATEALMPLIDRVEQDLGEVASVRGDAGFPSEGLLSALEGRCVGYAFRLKSNARLQELADPFLEPFPTTAAVEQVRFGEVEYRAGTWGTSRRILVVAVQRPGEIGLEHFYLVTSWSVGQAPAADILEFYRQRGNMEAHIGDFKSVLEPALSSTTRAKAHYRGLKPKDRASSRDATSCNAVNLLLYLLAYNLATSACRVIGPSVAQQRLTPEGHPPSEDLDDTQVDDMVGPGLESPNQARATEDEPPCEDKSACEQVITIAEVVEDGITTEEGPQKARAFKLPDLGTSPAWSIKRLRDDLLRAAGRIAVSSRQVKYYINEAQLPPWNLFWRGLGFLSPVATARAP